MEEKEKGVGGFVTLSLSKGDPVYHRGHREHGEFVILSLSEESIFAPGLVRQVIPDTSPPQNQKIK